MRNLTMGFAAALLLSQCATKHQPMVFSPHFAERPDFSFAPEQLTEMKNLEGRPSLSIFEKKRLVELYSIEMNLLKPTSTRRQTVSAAIDRLRPGLDSVDKELIEVKQEVLKYKDPSVTEPIPVTFANATLKREYREAYQLWNKDQNDAALKRVTEIVSQSAVKDKASHGEWFKVLNLRFRIAFDAADFQTSLGAYLELRSWDACAPETAQAGFLIALQAFSNGDTTQAIGIFDKQCDPDDTTVNKVRREYWAARFRESTGQSPQKWYQEVLRYPVPGYYLFLTKARLGLKLEVPLAESETPLSERAYLSGEWDVDKDVHHFLLLAEERLRANLRKDANIYLIEASHLLRGTSTRPRYRERDVLPMLYTAHLLQAAGNHLEAMRLYTAVSTELAERDTPLATSIDFLPEMFPRPFAPTVEWLCRLWKTDPDFIYAIMRQESAFNPTVISAADARGLMQLMPGLAKQLSQQWNYQTYYSDRMLFHADENLKLAVYHLYQLQGLAPHAALMAAAYNAGMNRVNSWWKRYGHLPLDVFVELIPINETRNYVKLVLRNYIYYKAMRAGGAIEASSISLKLPPPPDAGKS